MTQVRSWTRRLGVAAVATAAVTLAGASPASAAVSPTAAAAAVATTTADAVAATAAAASANLNNPDITCTTPIVGGVAVTYAADAVVAEVKAVETAAAFGKCLSYQNSAYDIELTLRIEYYDEASDTWERMCGARSIEQVHSGIGVAVAAPLVCTYEAGDAPDGKPHRARAWLTNTVNSTVYEGYSPVWLAGIGPVPLGVPGVQLTLPEAAGDVAVNG